MISFVPSFCSSVFLSVYLFALITQKQYNQSSSNFVGMQIFHGVPNLEKIE